jgi:hypothetical protein
MASVTLTAGQAAGTDPVVAQRLSRQALKIIPPTDCQMAVMTGQTAGEPIFGGVANPFLQDECPTNAIYLIGLTTGAVVQIWEA